MVQHSSLRSSEIGLSTVQHSSLQSSEIGLSTAHAAQMKRGSLVWLQPVKEQGGYSAGLRMVKEHDTGMS